jgi:acetyl-CoA carboxylase carboxyltransferase component
LVILTEPHRLAKHPQAVVPLEDLLRLVPEDPAKPYDMHEVIYAIVDEGDFLEVHPFWAQNIVVGFARLGGQHHLFKNPAGFLRIAL